MSDGWFALGMAAVCLVLGIVGVALTIASGGGIINIAAVAFAFLMAVVLIIVAIAVGR